MTQEYTILRSFIKEVTLNSQAATSPLAKNNLDMRIEVQHSEISSGSYLSDICIYIDRTQKSESSLFSMRFIYSTVVNFSNPESVTEQRRDIILSTEVPQIIYNKVRNIVWNLTSESDYAPIMLPDHSFLPKGESKEDIEFGMIMRSIGANEHFTNIIELYSTYTDKPFSYTDSPLYLHYLRFFTPIEYNHPTLSRCNNSTWQQLLAMLFGNPDVDCRFEYNTPLPDLKFSYLRYQEKSVAELTVSEIEALMTCMIADYFAAIIPHITTAQINLPYSDSLSSEQNITLSQMYTLYNINELCSAAEIAFVETLHKRISHYQSYRKSKKLS